MLNQIHLNVLGKIGFYNSYTILCLISGSLILLNDEILSGKEIFSTIKTMFRSFCLDNKDVNKSTFNPIKKECKNEKLK
jgi:hypothetical protein